MIHMIGLDGQKRKCLNENIKRNYREKEGPMKFEEITKVTLFIYY